MYSVNFGIVYLCHVNIINIYNTWHVAYMAGFTLMASHACMQVVIVRGTYVAGHATYYLACQNYMHVRRVVSHISVKLCLTPSQKVPWFQLFSMIKSSMQNSVLKTGSQVCP